MNMNFPTRRISLATTGTGPAATMTDRGTDYDQENDPVRMMVSKNIVILFIFYMKECDSSGHFSKKVLFYCP